MKVERRCQPERDLALDLLELGNPYDRAGPASERGIDGGCGAFGKRAPEAVEELCDDERRDQERVEANEKLGPSGEDGEGDEREPG